MEQDSSGTQRVVPVEFDVPEAVISRYATNLVIQRNGPEYIITFAELFPPVLLGTPDQQRAQISTIQSIKAHCVARIIVAADRMPEFAKAFNDILEMGPEAGQEKE